MRLCTIACVACAFAVPVQANTRVEYPRPDRLPAQLRVVVKPPSSTHRHVARDAVRRVEQRRKRGEISRREAKQLKREAKLIEAARNARDRIWSIEMIDLDSRDYYPRDLAIRP